MKYIYAYKTPDGVRHEETMNASSREEVFGELRKRGIKAIKVVAADGSKANGEVRGVRTRVVVALAFVVAVLSAVVAIVLARRANVFSASDGQSAPPAQSAQVATAASVLASETRRQVIGDAAIIEKGIRTGWSDVFAREGDRFLASFAIPGVAAGQRSTSEDEIRRALAEKVDALPDDPIEVQQIKAMVEGMKHEARQYIAAGGSIVDYGQRLVERQDAEIAIYTRAKNEVEAARKSMSEDAFEDYLEQRNDGLRNLGIRPVVIGE